MTVLDAYAVLAYLRGETAAEEVGLLLRSLTVLSAVNAAEVIDQLVRVYDRPADDVHADLAVLSRAGMDLTPVSAEVGLLADRLRARHYHRGRKPVSLADCVAGAIALSMGRPLATSDPPLAAMIRAEGSGVHPLPDSMGRMP